MAKDLQSRLDWLLSRFTCLSLDAEPNFHAKDFLQDAPASWEPPIYACEFSKFHGLEHFAAFVNEEGLTVIQDTRNSGAEKQKIGFLQG